ncbi:uncharacterized protein UHO2_01855 [Ustilago hordei]|uniref:uncharacterized protein n=1 Tax=Ustilago hordei TaxID=120017 RepID=UPI001A5DDA12|nr:uncharacterized protein UHO2_01855 [Ustilago hordei]SYW85611.1 uncharacterized protein UHO2_01855 [Ustilago hordei]
MLDEVAVRGLAPETQVGLSRYSVTIKLRDDRVAWHNQYQCIGYDDTKVWLISRPQWTTAFGSIYIWTADLLWAAFGHQLCYCLGICLNKLVVQQLSSCAVTVMMTPRSGVSVDDDEVDGVGDKVGGINTSVQCVDLMLEVIPRPQWTTAFGSILIQTANLLWGTFGCQGVVIQHTHYNEEQP